MQSLVIRSLFRLLMLSVPLVGAAFGQEIIPILRCERFDANENRLTTYWGYSSTFQSTVHLDIGDDNFFSSGVLFRNQPTDFQPGLHENVFATSYVVSGSQTQITWFLNGRTANGRPDTNRACDAPPNLGEYNPSTSYGAYVSVSHNGVLWVTPFVIAPAVRGEPGVDPVWSPLLLRGPEGLKGDTGDTGPSAARRH